MKNLLVMLLGALFFTPGVRAQVDSATMMKNFQDYMTPGEMHKMMASWGGNWQGSATMWMSPGALPETSGYDVVNKMIMGGRYQVSSYKGNLMGIPFEGMSTTGYDNAKKLFTSTWIDNMGSGIIMLEGPWDEASKTITMTGTAVNPGDGKTYEMKQVFKIVDKNTQIMEMYSPDPLTGDQYKSMEIKFPRKK